MMIHTLIRRARIKLAKLYRWFYNPYGLNLPGGYCPVQCEGHLPTGEFYYFRARWSGWRFDVCKTKNDWDNNIYLFRYSEPDYCQEPMAGWMTHLEAYKLMNKAMKQYMLERTTLKQ